MEDPGCRGSHRRSCPASHRPRPARYRAGCARDDQAEFLAARRHRHERGLRHRTCAVGYLGKHLNVPVWRLLGGQVRDKVGVYTHLGMGDMRAVYETDSVSALVERAREVVESGYRAFKAVFVPYTHYHAPLPQVDKVARMMEAMRAAVARTSRSWSIFTAARLRWRRPRLYRGSRPSRPMFVEEPVPPGDFQSPCPHCRKDQRTSCHRERLIDRVSSKPSSPLRH